MLSLLCMNSHPSRGNFCAFGVPFLHQGNHASFMTFSWTKPDIVLDWWKTAFSIPGPPEGNLKYKIFIVYYIWDFKLIGCDSVRLRFSATGPKVHL